MIKALFITTVMGSLLTLIITLLKPITKKYFGYNYHYYIWLCVLLVMVTPVKFNIPINNNIILPAYTEKILILGENNAFTTAPNETFNISENQITSDEEQNDWKKYVPRILFLIYISGFVLMMLVNIIGYIRLNYIIKNNAKAVPCPDIKNYTGRNIIVYASKELSSPFIIGVFKPRLIIPDCTLSDLQIENILSHEITHLKRWDILYKWFAVLVKCVHWFNPIVYYVEKEINIECEISCDLTVVSKMDSKKEMEYIDTIISLLKNMKPIKITTQMTGSNKDLKRRFSMIKNKKNISSKNKVLSVILAVILFITTLLTSGVLASDFKNSQHTIKVKDKGNIIALSNKPFYENGTIYLPLRELCEKLQLSEYINWDNGKVNFCLIEYDDTKKLHYFYKLEIGKSEYILNPEGTLPENIKHFTQINTMNNAPVLKNNRTYVPFEYIDEMININMIQGQRITLEYEKLNIISPVKNPKISRNFGERTHPVTGETVSHNGIDISAPEGTLVYASIGGTVTDVGFDNEMGNYITISSDNGITTMYGHLSETKVSKGSYIDQNSVIGTVGKTGTATGTFLHFEMKINETYCNPLVFIDSKEVVIEDNLEK